MKIYIGCDHRGLDLKNKIIKYLKDNDFDIQDIGIPNNSNDDYPEFAFKLGELVNSNKDSLGILICGSGVGMSIAANKVKGIRCAHCSNVSEAHLAREHNNANIIALSYKKDLDELITMIKEFLNTEPSTEERHQRRVNKIISYEEGTYNEL